MAVIDKLTRYIEEGNILDHRAIAAFHRCNGTSGRRCGSPMRVMRLPARFQLMTATEFQALVSTMSVGTYFGPWGLPGLSGLLSL